MLCYFLFPYVNHGAKLFDKFMHLLRNLGFLITKNSEKDYQLFRIRT